MPERLLSGGRLTIREIRRADDPAFHDAYALLKRTFPPHELVPRRELVLTLREGAAGVFTDLAWHFMVATRGDHVVGAASGWYVGSLNVGVIGYVVVTRSLRSSGLGPKLRRRLRMAFERDARRIRGSALGALVGEVEETNPWLHHLVARRGAIALDFTYLQPSIGSARPVPLVLYWEGLRPRRRTLPASTVRKLLYTVWRRVYRMPRPLQDGSFQRMLRSLAGRSRIGSRTLAPLRRGTRRRLDKE